MEEILLTVGEEQTISIGDYNIKFTFDPFNHEWHYDLSLINGEVLLTNVMLRINTYPLKDIADRYDYPKICLIDKNPDSEEEINPMLDFGDRLGVFEIVEA